MGQIKEKLHNQGEFLANKLDGQKKDESALSKHYSLSQLILFALPTIICAVFASIYGIVDGLFVSNVGGSDAFAAINLASPIFLIISSVGFMFGTGGSALVSKILGEGDKEKASKTFSLLSYTLVTVGIILAIICWFAYEPLLGLLGCEKDNPMFEYCIGYGRIVIPFIPCFMLMFYFQSLSVTAGKPVFGLIIMLAGGFTNIIGDAILVGGIAPLTDNVALWSVRGAAIATGVGLIISGIVPFIYYFFAKKSLIKLGKTEFSIKTIGQTCSNGISEFLSNISTSLVNTVFNGILLWIAGNEGVSAYGAISYINTLFSSFFMGYVLGVAPIVSYNFGNKNYSELKSIHKKNMIFVIASSIVMVLIAEALGGPIFGSPLGTVFAGGNEVVKEIVSFGMLIFAISFLFKGVNTYASGFFTALNDGLVSGILAVLRSLVFSIASVAILPSLLYELLGEEPAVAGIWWSVILAEGLALVTAAIFLIVKKKKYQY